MPQLEELHGSEISRCINFELPFEFLQINLKMMEISQAISLILLSNLVAYFTSEIAMVL